MKTSEKIYSAISIIFCGLILIGIASFLLVIIPKLEIDAANMFRFITIIMGVYALALGTTALINLKAKELMTVTTVIQIVTLFLTGYGLPFSIWGIVLLVNKNKRANQGTHSITDSVGSE